MNQQDKPPMRYRVLESGEYPWTAVLPGPRGNPVVLQYLGADGEYHDALLEDEEEGN